MSLNLSALHSAREGKMAPFEFSQRDRGTVPILAALFFGALLIFRAGETPFPVEMRSANRAVDAEMSGPLDGAAWSFRVNLNSAERGELLLLPGIGPSLADRIIEYRQTEGPFQSPEEIEKIRGIGKIKTAQLLPYLTTD